MAYLQAFQLSLVAVLVTEHKTVAPVVPVSQGWYFDFTVNMSVWYKNCEESFLGSSFKPISHLFFLLSRKKKKALRKFKALSLQSYNNTQNSTGHPIAGT